MGQLAVKDPPVLDRRSRAFFHADRYYQKSVSLLSALQSVFWLGFLDLPQLNQITSEAYRRLDRYRREDHNFSGLFAWEESTIESYFPPQGRLLIASSGAGREALELSTRGYTVSCFDCVPAMLAQSSEVFARAGLVLETLLAEPGKVPEKLRNSNQRFEGAIIGWGGYMHMQGRKNRIQFLREVSELLEPGAPLLVSFFIRARGPRYYELVSKGACLIRRLRGKPTDIEPGDIIQGTFDHHFTSEEIAEELGEAGFRFASYYQESFPHAVGIKI